MRLKRIELSGFKSFVDPTKIELGEGITSIVGPNGCGKSNIVDAIRWVLGEHSAKHLRGGVMDDLIFQGSDTRPPVAVCDVELSFAVNRGQLPSPYHEMEEIRIRRRLTRDGGSDAFINGKMVRIKDIVDIFLDTGVSTRAYAIVEQGSIARMVTAKPEERRAIFEEAAGVMKYRSRRREAELKMNSTRQNLERAVDLLEEVRSQCRSLKQQAARAERFKALQDEYSELQSVSLGLRYQALQERLAGISKRLAEAQSAEAEAAAKLAAAEKEVAEVRGRMQVHEEQAQGQQDELRAAEQKRANLQQQAERLSGERRLLSERCETLKKRIDEAATHLKRVESETSANAAEIARQDDSELQAVLREAKLGVESAEAAYRKAGGERDAAFSEYERLRHAGEHAAKRREQAKAAFERIAQRELRLSEQVSAIGNQRRDNEAALKQAGAAFTAAEKAVAEAEARLEKLQAGLDAARSEREAAAKARAEAEAETRNLKGGVEELRGRSQDQDVPAALRDQLRARGAIWMDESLDVPEGLDLAVAAALRGRSADVRIPANPDLSGWRDTLADMAQAPVALFTAKSVSEAGGESLAEAMALKHGHPLFEVFAGVRLVDDIFGHANDGTCVSRDGWRREADGWLVPPAQSRTASKLAVQRRLRQQEAAFAKADKGLTAAQARLAEAEAALENGQKGWQQAHLDATEAESRFRSTQAHRERLQAEAEVLGEREQRLQADREELAREKSHWQEQAAQAEGVDQELIEKARLALEGRKESLKLAETALNQARNGRAQAEQALALFAQQAQNLAREAQRLAGERERLGKQQAEDGGRLKQAEADLARAASHTTLDADLATAAAAVEAMHRQLNAVRQEGHALQQAVHEAEKRERTCRQELQHVSTQRQTIELEQAQERTRLQDLAGEIDQRCDVPVEKLLQRIAAMENPEDADTVLQRARDLEDRLTRFGPVNLLAIEEYQQAAEREVFLAGQADDLQKSLDTLTDTIGRIDRTMRQRFQEVFEQTNANFMKTFPQLFGGGRAELKLDSDDILTAGVEVIAQPPGKRLQDVTLLSGGEKALTAVALVFSIFQIKPAPFCILDEVDAPLDDANVGRFGDMVRTLADRVQFLAISHNKITMQKADRLVGVSMPEPGVSRIVAVDLEALPG
ncbi:MAG TPA: chromosome segregation protein SMC [Mariprofundaceae bacterium]|nr:chromosome segregation protein SMC [Mariprofundaceae bacterium]